MTFLDRVDAKLESIREKCDTLAKLVIEKVANWSKGDSSAALLNDILVSSVDILVC